MTIINNFNCLLLYEVTEAHTKWYEIYNPEHVPDFGSLLEINYVKLLACSGDDWKQVDYTKKLLDFKDLYENM